MDVVKCTQGSESTIASAALAVTNALDITTDLLSKFRWQRLIDVFILILTQLSHLISHLHTLESENQAPPKSTPRHFPLP